MNDSLTEEQLAPAATAAAAASDSAAAPTPAAAPSTDSTPPHMAVPVPLTSSLGHISSPTSSPPAAAMSAVCEPADTVTAAAAASASESEGARCSGIGSAVSTTTATSADDDSGDVVELTSHPSFSSTRIPSAGSTVSNASDARSQLLANRKAGPKDRRAAAAALAARGPNFIDITDAADAQSTQRQRAESAAAAAAGQDEEDLETDSDSDSEEDAAAVCVKSEKQRQDEIYAAALLKFINHKRASRVVHFTRRRAKKKE